MTNRKRLASSRIQSTIKASSVMFSYGNKTTNTTFFVVFLLLMPGCVPWNKTSLNTSQTANQFVNQQDSRSRLMLEIEFVNTSTAFVEQVDFDSLWNDVDETLIGSDKRQMLLNNGLRVGKINQMDLFREKIQSSITETNVVDEFLSQAAVASEISHGTQSVPLRLGKRTEFPLRQPFEGSHVALVRAGDETIGRTLANAQYFLALTATESENPRQIRLAIQPEVQFGSAKQKWVSSDSAIRIDTRRETWALDMLNLTLDLQTGDTIALAADHPRRGIAPKMLSGKGEDQSEQELIILIHVKHVPLPSDQLVANALR